MPCFRVEISPLFSGLWSYSNSFIVNFAWPLFVWFVLSPASARLSTFPWPLDSLLSSDSRSPHLTAVTHSEHGNTLSAVTVFIFLPVLHPRLGCCHAQEARSSAFCASVVFCHRCTVHRTCHRLPLTCSLCEALTTQVICQLVHTVVTLRWLRPGNFILRGTQSDLLLGEERWGQHGICYPPCHRDRGRLSRPEAACSSSWGARTTYFDSVSLGPIGSHHSVFGILWFLGEKGVRKAFLLDYLWRLVMGNAAAGGLEQESAEHSVGGTAAMSDPVPTLQKKQSAPALPMPPEEELEKRFNAVLVSGFGV